MQKVNGLEYEIHGEGEPVLLIHGSHVADAFLPLAREKALADNYRLIRYHRRGFCGSDPHQGSFSIEEQARDAEELLDALGVGRAHVVGHSYGAVIAMQLACQESSVVHSLTLLEPPTTTEQLDLSEVIEAAMAKYRSGDAGEAVNLFMGVVCGPNWRTEVQRTVPGGPEQAQADAATFFEVEVPALGPWILHEDEARQISQPVLYIIGSESGTVVEELKDAFQSVVSQTEDAVLQGLNHLLHMSNSGQVAAPIAAFLARHPCQGRY